MHRAIAEKLRQEPELLKIARENLERWIARGGGTISYWAKWREVLDRPLEEIRALIAMDSEEMRAMRQCTPFAGVLSPRERWAIYARFPLEGQ